MEEIISSRKNNNMCPPNLIEQLPDELLISIVSCLPMKDAARTSILSHRWQYFWAFTSILDFDWSLVISSYTGSTSAFVSENWIRFVNWVDRVLELHSGATIEEFRVSFDLDFASSDYINRWLEFAFMKRVKRLDLNFGYMGVSDSFYRFPNICEPIERFRIFPAGVTCGSLLSLRLSKISITGEVLESIISKCPLLEELCLKLSPYITSLIISGPLMRLRRLVVHSCPSLRVLKICAPSWLSHLDLRDCRDLSTLQLCSPNLHSFKLWGSNPTMSLKNVSYLVNLSLGPDMLETFASNFAQVSLCLSRLETLMIELFKLEVHYPLPKFPNLPNLKKLVLNVWAYGSESLLYFASLIDAAPMLREIVLKLDLRPNGRVPRMRGTIGPTKGQRHEGLEVLQIVGFSGLNSDVGLAGYVMEHAVSLKKVIINYGPPVALDDAVIIDKLAREGVRLLQANLPQGVQLIVTQWNL